MALALIRAHLKCAREGYAVHVSCLGEATWNEDTEDYYCHQCETRVPFGTVCDPPGQDYYEHDVGFLLALVDATAKSNAHAIAELCGQVNGLRERLEGSEHAMHLRVRAEYDSTIADCWREKLAAVTKERDEQTLRANRSEADVAILNAKLGYLTHEDRDK